MAQLLNRYATVAAASLFPVMAISGTLMFFEVGDSLKEAHEWLGLVFVLAVLTHLLRNWPAFAKLFTFKRTYVGLGLVLLITLAMAFGEEGGGGNPMRKFIDTAASAPISTLAPVLGQTPEAIVARLTAGGLKVDSPAQSLKELAEVNQAEMPRVLALATGSAAEDED